VTAVGISSRITVLQSKQSVSIAVLLPDIVLDGEVVIYKSADLSAYSFEMKHVFEYQQKDLIVYDYCEVLST